MPPTRPSDVLIQRIHQIIAELLAENPMATSSEAFVQNHIEFELVSLPLEPRYFVRIGINYHGQKIQHLMVSSDTSMLVGWNPSGDALGTGKRAKMLLAGYTIFDRDPDEPMMNDTKIGGGEIAEGYYVRGEFKVRGWLGKTKNLDGKQLEKDLDLLKNGQADLLVLCLSETAHRKWRGEGPGHHAGRRTGTARFAQILVRPEETAGLERHQRTIDFEGQQWNVSVQRVEGSAGSAMPAAEHFVTLCWRN